MSLESRYLGSIETADRNQWNNVVEQAPLGSVFHRYEWLRAIERGTSREPSHLVVSKKNNPVAIFPGFVERVGETPIRRLDSIRPGFGGPVVVSDEEASLELFLEAVPTVCDGTILFNQLNNLAPGYVRYHDTFQRYGYDVRVGQCSFELDLTRGWEDILDGMDSSRRRAIRNGHRRDHEVVDDEVTPETLADVHERFESVMDRVGGKSEPRSFFLEFAALPERVKILSLHVDGEERGSLLYVLDEEQSTIHYLYPAVTRDHFEYNASELIHEHAIKWGIDNGYERYDFGPTNPAFTDGLFRFKEQFGAREYPLVTWERGCPSLALPLLNAGRYVERRLSS